MTTFRRPILGRIGGRMGIAALSDPPRVAALGMAFPLTLPWSGLWRADYAGEPWVGDASDGASGGRLLSEATNPSTTGTAQNGFTPALFDGTNDVLRYTGAEDLIGDSTGWTYHGVWKFNSLAAPTGTTIIDPAIFALGPFSAAVALAVTSSGVAVLQYDTLGTSYETTPVAVVTGQYYRVQARWSTSTGELWLRIDGGTPVTVAVSDILDASAEDVVVGANYDATAFLDAECLEQGWLAYAESDTVLDEVDAYAVARYGLGGSSTASVVMGALTATPTFPSPTVVSRQAVVMGALAPTPSWPSPVVLGRQVISFDALTATPSWPSPTLTANASVVMGALAPTPSWPSPTVVSRQAVVFGALTATPTWPSPSVLGRQVIAMGAMAVTPTFPSPTLTSRQSVVMGALTATPTWPSPTVVVAGYVDMASMAVTPSWPAATFTARAAIDFAALTATPAWPLAVFSVPVLPVVLLTTRSAGETSTTKTSAGETRSATRSAGETSTAGTSAGETRVTFRSSGETR